MKKRGSIFIALALIFLWETSAAQIPRTLSYQGVLTDNASKPRPDGNYSFTFRFYTSPTGGTEIWSESKSLPVKNGLFSTVLGEQTPFGAAVKFDQQYWLGIQVGDEPELSPRIALTSVGYSFSSLRADTASVSVASLADTTWRHSGANIYRMNGNVGIGTNLPESPLDVNGNIRAKSGLELNGTGGATDNFKVVYDNSFGGLNVFHQTGAGHGSFFINSSTGNVGIGTTSPVSPLDVNGNIRAKSGLELNGAGGSTDIFKIVYDNSFGGLDVFHQTGAGHGSFFINSSTGDVGIGTTSPTSKLHVEGTTTTKVLAITGGGDLAEPFEISESQPIPKGALVIIDEENPGQLKLSHQAYDKRLAGVVSGAGGINPGLTLTQEGVLEDGQNVALSGRVYALATAANGPIKPGDLLTTSEVPGHAMKATDKERLDGSIIGKAMSSLESGKGLVLVLVNLQ